MPTPSGQISLDDVNTELGISPGTQINMDSAPVRGLAEVPTGAISMSDLQGKSNAQFVAATGGTITTSGDFKIHEFTSSGTFTVTNAGNSDGSNSVEYLVLAGGGSSSAVASGNTAGGGGAGGQLSNYPSPATGGLPVTATAFPVTVGGGGSAGTNSGSDSVFSTITTNGGGHGGGTCVAPASGGSGGGAARGQNPASGNVPSRSSPAIPAQGQPGGDVTANNSGGGGGTSQAGQNAGSGVPPSPYGGAGGNGTAISITGSSVTRGGGGGGCSRGTPETGFGGSGGGGAGGKPGGGEQNGSDGLGGGAGGGLFCRSGRSGGSGKVIIRYKFQ